ncbi:MAG TPA: VanW family protein [Acidimicrobiia bacterium]
MPHVSAPVRLTLLVAGSLVAMVLVVFGIDRVTNGGEVLGGVVVGGVNIGGLDEHDALARLHELEDELMTRSIPVVAAGHQFALDPSQIGFDVDEQAIVEEALRNGRTGNIVSQFGWWLEHLASGDRDIPVTFDYDEAALAGIVNGWETDGIADPAFPGDITMRDGAIVYQYPADGIGIESDKAMQALAAVLTIPHAPVVTLPTRVLAAALTDQDVDDAVVEARHILEGDVTLTNSEFDKSITIPRDVIANALVVTRDDSGESPRFEMSLDPAVINDYVAAFGPSLETEPTDAEIQIDIETDVVTIVPSLPVKEPDPATLVDAVWNAASTPGRTGDLPYDEGHDAPFSTADAEALGVHGLIGEFTTNYPCCAARVTNIHQIADDVDGTMILPGQDFSLNDVVGKRTTAKGYVCAGALIGGEIVEEGEICIGGGTSQFTTTMYNAAFFAGLEDVYHMPHTIWFSRYPEGREATLGWRDPELIFRNNTPNAIIVRTTYDATSVTVKIYGDNGGLTVEAGLSDRYNYTSPRRETRSTDKEVQLNCTAATATITQAGTPGWSVDVFRYITHPDGTMTTDEWTWHYEGYWEIKEYNPNGTGINGDLLPGCIPGP